MVKISQSKGNGGERHQPVGHQKYSNDLRIKFVGGNGCKRHDNCFTCPFPFYECGYGKGKNK
jgi:hypothetical protein